MLMGGGKKTTSHLLDTAIQVSSYGTAIPRVWGQVGVSGVTIWASPILETDTAGSGGGLKGGNSPTSPTQTFSGAFAVAACVGPIASFGRIWGNGKLIRNADGTGSLASYFALYTGTETQMPDPTIQADKGAGNVPAFRGIAYVVVGPNFPLADFSNNYPNLKIEIIQADGAIAIVNSAFISHQPAVSNLTIWKPGTYRADVYGNAIFCDNTNIAGHVTCFKQDGTRIWDFSASALLSLFDAFTGITVPRDAQTGRVLAGAVTWASGSYVVVTVFTTQHVHLALLSVVPSGNPAVLGYVNFAVDIFGVRAVSKIDLGGDQTITDPLILTVDINSSASQGYCVCPSVADLLAGTYSAGYPNSFAWNAFEVPQLLYTFTGMAAMNASTALAAIAGGNPDGTYGFCLPSPTLGTDLYIYISRLMMDGAVSVGGPALLTGTLQPAYPNGCTIKVPILAGLATFASTAAAAIGGAGGRLYNTAAPAYTVVNSSFTDLNAASQMPFTDEYTRISTGAATVKDAYQTEPLVERQSNGSYLVVFNMQGLGDAASASPANVHLRARYRAFLYNPATEAFVQQATMDGIIYSNSDFGSASNAAYDGQAGIILWHHGNQLYQWGAMGPASIGFQQAGQVYVTQIGTLDVEVSTTLATIVRDICLACGMTSRDFDTSALVRTVKGFVLGREMDGRTAIQLLQQAYFFDGVESDCIVKFKFRNGLPIATITESDLGAHDAANSSSSAPAPLVSEPRKQEQELPQQVVIRFMDEALDYQTNAARDRRNSAAVRSRNITSFDVPIVFNGPTEPKAIAEKTLFLAWIMRTTQQFTLPPPYLVYDVGDVLTLSYKGGTVTVPVYLTAFNFGANGVIETQAVTTDNVVYTASGAPGAAPDFIPPSVITIEATTLKLLDGPLLRDEDDVPGYYTLDRGSDANWDGATNLKSADDISTDFQVMSPGTATVAAITGHATTILASAPYEYIDRTSVVRISLDAGATMTSCSELAMLNGANRFMLAGECLGGATWTLVSPGVYDVSILLRGVQGTDWAIGTHAVNDAFLALANNGSVLSVSAPMAEYNLLRYYRGVSFSQLVSSVASVTLTPQFIRLKPLAPVHIIGARDGGNNLTTVWTPRARVDAQWRDGAETALDEISNNWQADVIVSSVVVRTITSTASANGSVVTPSSYSVLYEAADQTLDGITPGNPVTLNIYQMSSRVGRGYPGSATV